MTTTMITTTITMTGAHVPIGVGDPGTVA